ncbi:hypothetical protein [uncultured Erythrobacter sp.]|uniref:hypothetical protein n=1 Tax=uncultured Erythrobacter sp. TaxID=263913 RepID=UPI002635CE90|nr:hypothetical protein [uncultured Erythrobacter sp.]
MFQELKTLIVEHVGLAKDALHVYVALIVFLVVCRLVRWPASSWKPWLVVLAVAVLGEVLDLRHTLSMGYTVRLDYHWTDLWNTMLVPTVLVLVARYTNVFERRPTAEAGDPS